MKAYGHSILVKSNNTNLAPMTCIISGVVTVQVEFNHYDGIQLAAKLKTLKEKYGD